jgi:CubicO group peptidase (beta-lactamase class C family)
MKNTFTVLIIATLASIGSYAQDTTSIEEKVEKIEELIEANVTSIMPFSGSVLVAQNGEIVYKGAFGLADLEKGTKNTIDSKYFIGSITKQITTVAILQLVDSGKVSLDDKLSIWIPEINGADKISIHHLLSHQSGLRRDSYQDYDEDVSYLERVLSVKNDTLLFKPGTKSEYSSVGFYALTYILEQVSGMKYEKYFKKYIFKPAGMKNTGVRKKKGEYIKGLSIGIDRAPDEFGVDDLAYARYFDSYSLAGGGSLFSTVDDLHKFHVAVENGIILSKDKVELMKKRWPLENEPRPFNTYGWEVYDYSNDQEPFFLYDFSGRIFGYKAMNRYYKKENIVIIVLTNSEFSERAQLGRSIRRILLGLEYEIPKAAPKKIPLTEAMKKHEGVYDFASEKTTVEMKIINGKMTLTSHGDNPMYMYPADEYTFYSDLIPLKITFEPTTAEKTQKLEFNHGDEFIRTISRLEN